MKVLIVEDDILVAEELAFAFKQANWEVAPIAITAEDGIAYFDEHEPHLVLIDIVLKSVKDGITVAEYVNSTCRVPFIYLSEHFGKANKYFRRASDTRPAAYLPKGAFLPVHLWHYVDLALAAYFDNGEIFADSSDKGLILRKNLFIKTGSKGRYDRIDLDQVLHLQYNRPYSDITLVRTENKAVLRVRKSMDDTILDLAYPNIVRIHKQHAVNIEHIITYDPSVSVVTLIDGTTFEIGRTYKQAFERKINLLR
ncbi:MAG: hypothetical protein RL660_2400 [Bacteroidota bacterium]|jgi:DNA-binding LytR/AlgR family response regulator